MKNRTSVRRIELSTQFFDGDGNAIITIEKIKDVLEEHKKSIKNYAYILHDKDTKKATSEDGTETIELVKPHIHLGIRFNYNNPQHLEDIATWFDVKQNCLEKIKGSWDDYLLYLIHANAPDKYQYSTDNVIANFDFEAAIEKAKNTLKIKDVLQKIMDGEIRDISEIDGFTYIDYTREINEAFRYRHNLLSRQTDRDIEVIMITGESGSGKTTLAKRICEEKGLDIFISSSSNDPFYGYNLAKAIILDDLRGSTLSASDLLKILDNHYNSTAKSRYHNKALNCSLIIITTVLEVDSFFRQVFENEQEPVTQLKRRIGTYIKMNKHTITVRKWNDLDMCYSEPITYFNDTLVPFEAEKIADTRTTQEKIESFLPFLAGKEIPHTNKSQQPKKPNTEQPNTEKALSETEPTDFFKLEKINLEDTECKQEISEEISDEKFDSLFNI